MNVIEIFEPAFGAATSAVLNGVFKASLMIAVALLLDLALRRLSAALRHRLWTAAFAGLLMLPVASYAVPTWHLPLVTAPARPAADEQAAPMSAANLDGARSQTADDAQRRDGEVQRIGDAGGRDQATRPWTARVPWGTALAALWIAGTVFLLARLAYAIVCASRTARRAAELADDGWQELAERTRRRLGLPRPVRIAHSAEVDMPMAWGIRRHTVLLPAGADGWSEERREVVLTHEMAHVRRGDCAAQLVSSTAAALHWFNPLVWIARRRQASERELACDDAVLSSGAAGADYAWHLLEIARASGRAQPFSPAGVMMARKSQLEGRLLAVLDPGRDRREVSRPGSLGVSSKEVVHGSS